MELDKGYLSKFKKAKDRGPRSRNEWVAEQVWNYFGKQKKGSRLSYPAILGMIRNKGTEVVYQIWNDLRQSDPRNRESLFLWRIGQAKVGWEKKM